MNSIRNQNENDNMLNELLENRIIQCNKCGHDYKIIIKNKNTYKRCQFKLCIKEESFFKNSHLYNKHLNIYQILHILKLRFSKMPVSSIAELTIISQKTISCYLKRALKHIETTYLETLEMIRGPCINVELDKSNFSRIKYY
ncbi:hypothetical protein H312_00536 [Anncaliia algerae PRA339]|uniref:Uncharacterized protein n=1 Tax=Anncaliia algerae PRA339 TaxID=1288291 RepID=A0A059F515_9MICR|nr:hypothetical protein H312_00536 [Anncaliia algerae PRA339]